MRILVCAKFGLDLDVAVNRLERQCRLRHKAAHDVSGCRSLEFVAMQGLMLNVSRECGTGDKHTSSMYIDLSF